MASSIAGPIIGPSPAVELVLTAAGCVNRVADVPAGVLEGWPNYLDESMAWTGAQFADESDYIHILSESDLQEAENALRAYKALGLDGDCVSQDNFPLPTLGPQLDRIRRDVHQGKGFGVIRGLDPQTYSVEDLTVLYLGIQSYIANRHGRQDRKGNMLVHIVTDSSFKLKCRLYFRANQSNSTGSSRYYTLVFLVLFFVSAMASAIDTSLTTATSLESLSSTTSTFTVENSLPGCGWPKTLQDAQDPLSSMMGASVSLDIGLRPLLLENGNLELLVGIISLCSRDGRGKILSQSSCQAKLQTKPTDDNPWAPRIDTVVALLSLMVAVLSLVPAYFTAFLAWRA
ncbi:hypothetical protein FOVG_01437 [Fusarium oxysporum f. sp. pisi HDV247]|uniref:Uncharacterized protein n=1 Tax=Fusarium oxysporum f. sp. pisi HDV247 TaxID=1080344 RepID=W9QEZ5_FUSOX|nr:hypothetical protein FOVG_01437 [Fusarium oxysporum f. sp. pisi HDV247]